MKAIPGISAVLTCDRCQTEVEVADAGWTVECPRCFQRLIVPRQFRRPEKTSVSPSSPASAGRRAAHRCRHHPLHAAGWRCDRCQAYLCRECVTWREVRGLTLEVCTCGGHLVSLSAEEAGTAAPAAQRLLSAFAYPLQGHGIALLGTGAVVLWAVAAVAARSSVFALFPVFALVLQILVAGYMVSYLVRIVSETANGDDEPPEWHGVEDVWERCVKPLLLLAGTTVFSFGPALAYASYRAHDPTGFWLLLAAGGFYFPMGLTAVAMMQSFGALNPLLILTSVSRAPASYYLACLAFFAAGAAEIGGHQLAALVPHVGTLLATAIALYLLMAQARILGLMYRLNQGRLDWF